MFFFKPFVFWPFLLWTKSFVSSFDPNSSILNLFLHFKTSNKKKKNQKRTVKKIRKRKKNIRRLLKKNMQLSGNLTWLLAIRLTYISKWWLGFSIHKPSVSRSGLYSILTYLFLTILTRPALLRGQKSPPRANKGNQKIPTSNSSVIVFLFPHFTTTI